MILLESKLDSGNKRSQKKLWHKKVKGVSSVKIKRNPQ